MWFQVDDCCQYTGHYPPCCNHLIKFESYLFKGEGIMGEISDDMLDGLCCSHCGTYFESEHWYPVLCVNCYDSETKTERAGLPKATILELGENENITQY